MGIGYTEHLFDELRVVGIVLVQFEGLNERPQSTNVLFLGDNKLRSGFFAGHPPWNIMRRILVRTDNNMSYAVFILGPSGSGKSTLTSCIQQVYGQLQVPATVVNLDAANESTNKYTPDIDIN